MTHKMDSLPSAMAEKTSMRMSASWFIQTHKRPAWVWLTDLASARLLEVESHASSPVRHRVSGPRRVHDNASSLQQ